MTIISNLKGGLGNQLFQYSIGLSYGLKNGKELKLDISDLGADLSRPYLLNNYNISGEIAEEEEIKSICGNNIFMNNFFTKFCKWTGWQGRYKVFERMRYQYDAAIFLNNEIKYLKGYWQSFKYFEDIRDRLLSEFELVTPLDDVTLKIMDSILESNAVSVHVRRGDYVSNKVTMKNHGVCGLDYYLKAIELLEKKYDNLVFYIFSDDSEWARANFRSDLQRELFFVGDINSERPYFDLELMKNCKHNIIANSTFSWWAAWLNKNQFKTVICPQNWVLQKIKLDDLLCEEYLIL